MPLGIELAAAWTRQIPCAEIAKEIERELDFLTTRLRNVPERHRSIRAVFSYSWQQLTHREQQILQQLSVFRGRFTRQAARAVTEASLPLLSNLVDKSLLAVDENGRYQIHELLRQFSAEQLAQLPEIEAAVQKKHGRYYLSWLAAQKSIVTGPDVAESVHQFERSIANIRAAIQWAMHHEYTLFNQPVAYTLWQLIDIKGWFKEGELIFVAIASKLKTVCDPESSGSDEEMSPSCRDWAIYNIFLAYTEMRLSKYDQAKKRVLHSLSFLHGASDNVVWATGFGQLVYGTTIAGRLKYSQQIEAYEKGFQLLESVGDIVMQALASIGIEQVLHVQGEYGEMERLIMDADARLSRQGEKVWHAYILNHKGRLAFSKGNLSEAEAFFKASLAQRESFNSQTGLIFNLIDLGQVETFKGNYAEAYQYLRQGVQIGEQTNITIAKQRAYWVMGNLAVAQGDFQQALHYYDQAGGISVGYGIYLGGPGWAALGLGRQAKAVAYFRADLRVAHTHKEPPIALDNLIGLAYGQAQTGQLEEAAKLLALVLHHPASSWVIKEKAMKLWEELTAELPSELVSEARGRELDLWETAVSFLKESDKS